MAVAEDTPLMQQWRDVKSRHQDALVFFRVGDFYELFYGDAEEGSKLLGLTLTVRDYGRGLDLLLGVEPELELDVIDPQLTPDLAGTEVLSVDVHVCLAG